MAANNSLSSGQPACQKNKARKKNKVIDRERTTIGSELFTYIACLHTTTFICLSIFSLLETICLEIWERPCSLPVSARDSKSSRNRMRGGSETKRMRVKCGGGGRYGKRKIPPLFPPHCFLHLQVKQKTSWKLKQTSLPEVSPR